MVWVWISISKSGRGFGYDFAWDIVCIFHIFLHSGFNGGSGTWVKECFGSWDYWLLVVLSCKFEAIMVTNWCYWYSVFGSFTVVLFFWIFLYADFFLECFSKKLTSFYMICLQCWTFNLLFHWEITNRFDNQMKSIKLYACLALL